MAAARGPATQQQTPTDADRPEGPTAGMGQSTTSKDGARLLYRGSERGPVRAGSVPRRGSTCSASHWPAVAVYRGHRRHNRQRARAQRARAAACCAVRPATPSGPQLDDAVTLRWLARPGQVGRIRQMITQVPWVSRGRGWWRPTVCLHSVDSCRHPGRVEGDEALHHRSRPPPTLPSAAPILPDLATATGVVLRHLLYGTCSEFLTSA